MSPVQSIPEEQPAWFLEEICTKSNMWIARRPTTIQGTLVIEACHRSAGMPIGSLWYCDEGNGRFDIMGMYVIDFCRRKGVASWMYEHLLSLGPKCVTTESVTDLSKEWVSEKGFEWNENMQWFERHIPNPKS